MKKVGVFRPDRLKIWAENCFKYKKESTVQLLDEISEYYIIEDKVHGNVSVFVGAIAMLPDLFPKEWFISDTGQYYYKKDDNKNTVTSLILFFGINLQAVTHLIVASGQLPQVYRGNTLNTNSSYKEIGRNMLFFIKAHSFTLELLKELEELHSKN